jgi:hypothetical protein
MSVWERLNFNQFLRGVGELEEFAVNDREEVFDADTAIIVQVNSRFNGEDHAFFEFVFGFG